MKLEITITTKSNLYIGGMPQGFEIGGIDMTTATRDGKPYIPASSFKGALKDICRDLPDNDIAKLFKDFPDSANEPKHLSIFGIGGYNRTPKLIFTDFEINMGNEEKSEESPKKENLFSIDIKNSIEEKDGNLTSNPRTYKVVRNGLIFTGNIILNFDSLNDKDNHIEANSIVKEYIEKVCGKFKEGLYRLGNSKSRGYGLIEVLVKQSEDEKA